MAKTVEHVHWPDAPDMWMPYAPAIKVKGGTTIYLAGVTAAPVYHHHPHRPEEFDSMPRDMEGQARAALENLKRGLEAVGATLRRRGHGRPLRHRSFGPGRVQPGVGRILPRRQAGHDHRAGGAARHRSALSGRDQCGGRDRLIGPARYRTPLLAAGSISIVVVTAQRHGIDRQPRIEHAVFGVMNSLIDVVVVECARDQDPLRTAIPHLSHFARIK